MKDVITGLKEIDHPAARRAEQELDRFLFLATNPIQVTRYRLGDIEVSQLNNGLWTVSRLDKFIAQDGSIWNELTKICQFPLHQALRIAKREREKGSAEDEERHIR